MKRILFACAMGMPLGALLDYMAMLAYGSYKPTAIHVWMAITGACIFWICYELTPKILNTTKPKTGDESEVLNIPRVSNSALQDNSKLVDNMCMSYRHDFGLMAEQDKQALRFECKEWLRAYENNREHCT